MVKLLYIGVDDLKNRKVIIVVFFFIFLFACSNDANTVQGEEDNVELANTKLEQLEQDNQKLISKNDDLSKKVEELKNTVEQIEVQHQFTSKGRTVIQAMKNGDLETLDKWVANNVTVSSSYLTIELNKDSIYKFDISMLQERPRITNEYFFSSGRFKDSNNTYILTLLSINPVIERTTGNRLELVFKKQNNRWKLFSIVSG